MTMRLLELYTLWESKDISEEAFAKALSLTVTSLRKRIMIWGHRLPLCLATLDKISEGKITRDEAADTLGINVRQVNALMSSWKITRPIAKYLVDRGTSAVKWELHTKYAIEVIAEQATFEEAAEATGLTSRQVRRDVAALLQKHFRMPYKDLRTLSSAKRQRLADEIEEAEGLEMGKLNVLRLIANGEKSTQEVAIERLLTQRNTRNHDVRGRPAETRIERRRQA